MKHKGSVSDPRDMKQSRHFGGEAALETVKMREPIRIPLRKMVRVGRKNNADVITTINKIPVHPRLRGKFISPPPELHEGVEVPSPDGRPYDFVTVREQEARLQDVVDNGSGKRGVELLRKDSTKNRRRLVTRRVTTGCIKVIE